MATGHGQVGYGATLSWNSQVVARLTKMGEFGWEVDKADVTTFSSASAFKEKAPGMIDSVDTPFEGFLATDDTTGQMTLLTDARARTSRTALITLPTTLGTATFTGTAFISKISIGDMVPGEGVPIKFTLTWTGATTWASAA